MSSVVALKRKFEPETEIIEPGSTFSALIKPGEYEAQCIGFKEFRQYGGGLRLALTWSVIIGGLEQTVLLPQFFSMHHKVFKEITNYYQAWVTANNYQRPIRRTRQYMSPKIFMNILGTVIVCTVIPKFENGKPKPEVFHYSKVQRLLCLSVPNNGGVK